MKRIRHPLLVGIFFSIWYAIFFSPVLFSGKLLAPGDGIIQYFPNFHLRKLWEPLIQCGFPIAADPQSMTWYPLSFFFYLLHSWNSFVVSAYVLASSFVYGYVFNLTHSRFAGIFSGLAFGMTGFMISHLGHTSIIHTAVWLPAMIWSLEKLRQRFLSGWFLLACIFVACTVLAGHIQITLYVLGLSFFYILFRAREASMGAVSYFGLFFLIVFLGLSLASVQLLPAIQLAQHGTRTADYSFFISYSLPLFQSVTFLFPYLFGSPQLGPFGPMFGSPLWSPYVAPYFGSWNLSELGTYVGLFPILLAVLVFFSKFRGRLIYFWAFVAIFSFVAILGEETPLAKLLFQIPILNKFRAPSRNSLELALAVSILSGIALSQIQNGLIRFRTVITGSAVGLVILLLLCIWLQYSNRIHTLAAEKGIHHLSLLPWTSPAIGVPLLTFLLVSGFLLYWTRQPKSIHRQALTILVLILDLGTFIWFRDWRLGSPSINIMQPDAVAKR